jgi:hypothetical protein
MLVLFFVIFDTHVRHGLTATIRRVVMTRPDFGVVWQSEKLTRRVPEAFSAPSGEVATCGADVRMEDRITTEYII